MGAIHRFSFPWRRVLALFFACLVCTALWAEAAQAQLAEKVIRLHVLANSDTEADQTLKLQVRDKILAQTNELLAGQESAAEAAAILRENLEPLAQTAAREIAARGYDYPVEVRLEKTWFPTRRYEDVSLPAGNYQALRVLIGAGEGHNWWCVVFPPLCLSAAEAETALETLGADDAGLLSGDGGGVVFKFRLLELWGELMELLGL